MTPRFAKGLFGVLTALLLLSAAFAVVVVRAVAANPAWLGVSIASIEGAANLRIETHGGVAIRLLPQPVVEAVDVTVADPRGMGTLKVSKVEGTLSLFDLLLGRGVLDRIRLDGVTGWIDADAAAWQWALSAYAVPGSATRSSALPSRLSVTSGFVQVVSKQPGLSGFLSDLHGALDGFQGGAATLSGSASWHGARAEISGRLDSLAEFFSGRPTSGSFRIKSDVASASLVGSWTRVWRGGFRGNVTASTPALPSLLRTAGFFPGVLSGVGQISFDGTAEPSETGMAFSSARLVVDGDTLEGSLALQDQAGRLTLVGTLATDDLDLAPFAAALPALRSPDGRWSIDVIPFSPADLHDVDLRISAGHLKLSGLQAQDAALSVLCQNGRMEVSLGEAHAYGGTVKGRLFSNADAADLALKLDASWSQVDLAALSKGVAGASGDVAGSTSGSVMAEGRGGTASALVRNLEGRGQASWHQGKVGPLPVLDALLRSDRGESLPATPTSFDLATLEFRIKDGTLVIGHAGVTTPEAHVTVSGQTSLAHQSYLLSSVSAPVDTAATNPDLAPIRRVAGLWGGPVHRLDPAATPFSASQPDVTMSRP